MQGPGSVTGQIDPTEKVHAASDDLYTAGRCLLPRTCSLQLPKGVHRCHAKHVALALKLLPTFYDLKSNECRTSLLYSRKFSSANNFVKSDRQAVRQEFIFVKCRTSLVCSSIVRSSLFCLSFIFFFALLGNPTGLSWPNNRDSEIFLQLLPESVQRRS